MIVLIIVVCLVASLYAESADLKIVGHSYSGHSEKEQATGSSAKPPLLMRVISYNVQTMRSPGRLKAYDVLMRAKTAEVQALTEQMEKETKRSGKFGVGIFGRKEDLSDTKESLSVLEGSGKIPNENDALVLFKETLPGSASFIFMHLTESTSSLNARAAAMPETAKVGRKDNRQRLDAILLAICGGKINFDKVVTMIDGMVALLKQEQLDDNHKKEYCVGHFDNANVKKKKGKLTASIEDTKESTFTLTDKIKKLGEGIEDLDKTVAEAFESLYASDFRSEGDPCLRCPPIEIDVLEVL